MQTDNRLFDDLAKVASGAMHTFGGVRDEVEARFRERFERWANEMGFVTREEFEATKTMAQRARLEQEDLIARLSALEARLNMGGAQAEAATDTQDNNSGLNTGTAAEQQNGDAPKDL